MGIVDLRPKDGQLPKSADRENAIAIVNRATLGETASFLRQSSLGFVRDTAKITRWGNTHIPTIV